MTDYSVADAVEEIKKDFVRFSFYDTPEEYAEHEINTLKSCIRKAELKKQAYTAGFLKTLAEVEGKDITLLAEAIKSEIADIDRAISYFKTQISAYCEWAGVTV